MKKLLLTFFLIAGTLHFVTAQQSQDEKVKALKIAFITERLQLTSSEAKEFWPVYNSYEKDIRKLRLDSRDGDILENEEKLLQIRKKYGNSFEKMLGKEKTVKLFQAEKDFRNVLIKQLRNRGKSGRNH